MNASFMAAEKCDSVEGCSVIGQHRGRGQGGGRQPTTGQLLLAVPLLPHSQGASIVSRARDGQQDDGLSCRTLRLFTEKIDVMTPP